MRVMAESAVSILYRLMNKRSGKNRLEPMAEGTELPAGFPEQGGPFTPVRIMACRAVTISDRTVENVTGLNLVGQMLMTTQTGCTLIGIQATSFRVSLGPVADRAFSIAHRCMLKRVSRC